MKRTAFFFVIFLLFTLFLSAQSRFQPRTYQLKLSPLRLIDPVNPGAEVSLQKNWNAQNATQLSYAHMTDFLSVQSRYDGYTGNRFAFEQKHFFHPNRANPFYLSLEAVYASVNYHTVGSFEPKPVGNPPGSSSPSYADSIHLFRKAVSVNLRGGYELFFFRRLVFDVAVGLGVKFRNVTHEGRLSPNDIMVMPRHPNAYYEAEAAGKKTVANLPLTFKLGYCF